MQAPEPSGRHARSEDSRGRGSSLFFTSYTRISALYCELVNGTVFPFLVTA